jgi:glycosyltransferase involved in cell wall biosynthesis
MKSDQEAKHETFISTSKAHILMITNHGVHEWDVVPGLPDTGGQNVFVNQFSKSLTNFGYKITIVNRGGYRHPVTGEWQRGIRYRDEHQRILYIEDAKYEFVRKEDMYEQIPGLVATLQNHLSGEGITVDLIISHYWDAAKIGVGYNESLTEQVTHIWVPHSLGTLKKRNVNPNQWTALRIDERVEAEISLIQHLDGIAATSSTIRTTLKDDYGYNTPEIFLPPCVDEGRYYPRKVPDDDKIWNFLSDRSALTQEEIRKCNIVSEISRTDTTKRKNVLIEAFSIAHNHNPDSLLVVSIDDKNQGLAQELRELIQNSGAAANIVEVGSIWDILPVLYAVTDIYCTPSVMEGFGMSAQEAAATKVPVVASNLVPFVDEYLLGEGVEEIWDDDKSASIRVGQGAIVCRADEVNSFALALDLVLKNESLRREMGRNAYSATIPYFTWDNMVRRFLESIDFQTK